MKKLLIIIFALFLAAPTFAQPGSYKSKVKKMLSLTGAEQTFSVAIDQMMGQMRSMRSDVDTEIWDEVEAEFKKTSIDDLVELLVPVYYKYLTEEDLDGIIAFYQTPVGRKYASSTPDITRDSMIAGQEWGAKLGEKVANKLAEKGY